MLNVQASGFERPHVDPCLRARRCTGCGERIIASVRQLRGRQHRYRWPAISDRAYHPTGVRRRLVVLWYDAHPDPLLEHAVVPAQGAAHTGPHCRLPGTSFTPAGTDPTTSWEERLIVLAVAGETAKVNASLP